MAGDPSSERLPSRQMGARGRQCVPLTFGDWRERLEPYRFSLSGVVRVGRLLKSGLRIAKMSPFPFFELSIQHDY